MSGWKLEGGRDELRPPVLVEEMSSSGYEVWTPSPGGGMQGGDPLLLRGSQGKVL